MASSEHPVWRGHSKEAKRRQPCGPRITRNCAVMGSLLLPCAPTWLFLVAGWCLMGATPRGQPWTLALMLPHGRDGLSARRLAVWWTFHEPSLGRHVLHELMRNAVLNLTLIIPANTYKRRSYYERYSRSSRHAICLHYFDHRSLAPRTLEGMRVLGYAPATRRGFASCGSCVTTGMAPPRVASACGPPSRCSRPAGPPRADP